MAKFSIEKLTSEAESLISEINEENLSQVEHKMVPILDIEFNPYNEFNKFDTDEQIQELADDIKENGLYHIVYLQKQTGKEKKYMLISGERRVRACMLNGDTTVFATVAPEMDKDKMLYQLYGANIYARTLTNSQKIDLIKNLYDKLSEKGREGFNERIGKLLQVDDRQVRKLVATSTKLVPELVELVKRDLLSINDAASYVPLPDEYQRLLAETINNLIKTNRYLPTQKKLINEFVRDIKGNLSLLKKDTRQLETKILQTQVKIEELERSYERTHDETELARVQILKREGRDAQASIEARENRTNIRLNGVVEQFKERIYSNVPFVQEETFNFSKTVKSIEEGMKRMERAGIDITVLKAALSEIIQQEQGLKSEKII